MKTILLTFETFSLEAELLDTPTANAIYDKLPLSASIQAWGKELYFTIPVSANLENDAREIVEEGDLAFWPTGNAFCIFWGKTPASTSNKPQAVSPVNVFGTIKGDLSKLNSLSSGNTITIKEI